MVEGCEHGYGGFFKCPKGCHSKGPEQDYEDFDRDITYFFKRLNAHGMTLDPFVHSSLHRKDVDLG